MWATAPTASFNVAPRNGFERNREGELILSLGNFWQTNDQLSFGDHSEKFAYYASLNAEPHQLRAGATDQRGLSRCCQRLRWLHVVDLQPNATGPAPRRRSASRRLLSDPLRSRSRQLPEPALSLARTARRTARDRRLGRRNLGAHFQRIDHAGGLALLPLQQRQLLC